MPNLDFWSSLSVTSSLCRVINNTVMSTGEYDLASSLDVVSSCIDCCYRSRYLWHCGRVPGDHGAASYFGTNRPAPQPSPPLAPAPKPNASPKRAAKEDGIAGPSAHLELN